MFNSILLLNQYYPLNTICSALGINKSSYLYWLKVHDNNENIKLLFFQQIIHVYVESYGIYGAPKISAILNHSGVICSVSTVSRAMSTLGLKSIVSKSFPKKVSKMRENEKAIIINLIKNLTIDRLNQVWTTDITYIKTIMDGNLFLVTFLDYYSKKIIAWGLFKNQTMESVNLVLIQAIKNRNPPPGTISHSDKGAQFRSYEYRAILTKNHLLFSYTSLNHSCDENAAQESFHALLKREWLYQKKLYTYNDAYREIFNYIDGFYNPIRVHSSIGNLSPDNFENLIKSNNTPS